MSLTSHPLMQRLEESQEVLTAKDRVLNDFITSQPRKVVFMTIKELSRAAGVSEATVIRFVRRLGYAGYNQFQQDLRDLVDTEMTLVDRMDLQRHSEGRTSRVQQVVQESIANLQHFLKSFDRQAYEQAIQALESFPRVYVAGSRLSFAPAYSLGWGLTKVRSDVHILKGSDSSSLDWLVNSPQASLVAIVSTTRYPNELNRLGKSAKRLGHSLLVLADSSLCPLLSVSDIGLALPSKNIPTYGDLTIMNAVIRAMLLELADRFDSGGNQLQSRLEQVYLENDVFFNLK